jgi:hypothetical protein
MQAFTDREIDARARAKKLGVFVTVRLAREWYQSPSQSNPGEIYDLVRTGRGWACTCKGWQFTGLCKHLGALERRAEREGWSYGFRVARPITPVARPADEMVYDAIRRETEASDWYARALAGELSGHIVA